LLLCTRGSAGLGRYGRRVANPRQFARQGLAEEPLRSRNPPAREGAKETVVFPVGIE
jgi:hypothetical protein